jgi:alcohol dehydrogenase, propanol-preferring
MMLTAAGSGALELCDREVPIALPGEVLLRVRACGMCAADLHIIDGEMPAIEMPIVPGHAIVGIVDVLGDGVTGFTIGDRAGLCRVGYACGACDYCASGRENLCREARFTGCHLDGGGAEYAVADAAYAFAVPARYPDAEVASLLCAGVTGYRAYRMIGSARRLALYGSGAALSLIAQIAAHEGRDVRVVTVADPRPEAVDAAIVVSTDGHLITEALSRVSPGGIVVCAGFPLRDVVPFSLAELSGEPTVRSVSNFTRQDVREFLALAATIPLTVAVQTYPLADANQAIADLREGRLTGDAVLRP